jgi:hypothetical protein
MNTLASVGEHDLIIILIVLAILAVLIWIVRR